MLFDFAASAAAHATKLRLLGARGEAFSTGVFLSAEVG